MPREVFERSAFIGQNALAVDQDAELERRIAALITTGEEDTSYTESYDRLKKQLNRRRHNKTGLIPALERETDQLRAALAELDALNDQAQQSRRELDALERRAADNFRIRYAKVHEPGSDNYAVDHSAGMILLGPDGQFIKKFAFATL